MARTILIVGGGVAGWMAAAALSRTTDTRVTLIETEDSGGSPMIAGPTLRDFHASLGIDESNFLAATRGTIRLGTHFVGPGLDYIHAYADIGASLDGIPFHHLWLKLHAAGQAGAIGDYSLGMTAAKLGRFARPTLDRRATLDYGYHFDAGLYAEHLRAHSPAVIRHPRNAIEVKRGADGSIEAMLGLQADLYLNCSGRAAMPLEGEWEAWPELPSNLTMVSGHDLSPLTTMTHSDGGWRSIVPLQHGDGREQDSAFSPGRRKQPWQGNRVAIGHAAASVPPLETSEADLVALDLARLAAHADAERYNRAASHELAQIRDFTALLSGADMQDSLGRRIEPYRHCGNLPDDAEAVYRPASWLAAMLGQGILPGRWDPRADMLDANRLAGILRRYAMLIGHSAQSMPRHADYLAHHCPAPAPSARGDA